jgi:two-component system response regulator YesN
MVAQESILVVDDDPGLLEAVSAALGTRYHVETASTATTAFDAISARPFDLLLLDHRLPDIPGTEVLRLIKKFFPSMLVMIITGYGSEDVAVQALRGGARDYLRKPFDVRELESRVRSLLALRRKSGERRRNPLVELYEAQAFRGDAIAEDPQMADEDRAIFRAVRHIEENLDQPLRLAEVARIAGMSKFHFCRRFQAHTGQYFREFLARRRIERAKGLMKQQRRTLTDIFRDAGFRDMTNFTRVFKRIEGQVPSQFRRRKPDDVPEPPAVSPEKPAA